MRAAVRQLTGIPTCVGIGPTKTIAKLANFASKKNPIFQGVCDMTDAAMRDFCMQRIDVGEVWGVGRATHAKLLAQRIATVAQLRDMPPPLARKIGTVVLERIVAELRGIRCLELDEVEPRRNGMAVTRSPGTPIMDIDTMCRAITAHATRAAEKLRSHNLVTGTLSVFYHTNPHRPDRPQRHASRTTKIKPMSANTFDLVEAAIRCVRASWKTDKAYGYTKAGVMIDDLLPPTEAPQTLFEFVPPRSALLMNALDAINDRYGKKSMVLASEGLRDKSWHLKSEMRSPRYTTRISDLPVVSV